MAQKAFSTVYQRYTIPKDVKIFSQSYVELQAVMFLWPSKPFMLNACVVPSECLIDAALNMQIKECIISLYISMRDPQKEGASSAVGGMENFQGREVFVNN